MNDTYETAIKCNDGFYERNTAGQTRVAMNGCFVDSICLLDHFLGTLGLDIWTTSCMIPCLIFVRSRAIHSPSCTGCLRGKSSLRTG